MLCLLLFIPILMAIPLATVWCEPWPYDAYRAGYQRGAAEARDRSFIAPAPQPRQGETRPR